MKRRIKFVTSRTYHPIKVIGQKPKQHTNDYITSYCVTKFYLRLCELTCIGKSIIVLLVRVNEHKPK